jgi:peptidylprolyl isomerase
LAAFLDAVVGLVLLSYKAQVIEFCHGESVTLRDHARRALALMGDSRAVCAVGAAKSGKNSGASAKSASSSEVRLEFETEIGLLGLTLDPTHAPLAVARIVKLVEDGFFNNMLVHQRIPGFIVQFGDKSGDGFGAPRLPPLPLEVSPKAFAGFDVGMALSGKDSAQSQLFVTLGRFPELDGKNTWIGRAEAKWALLARGDRILRATVKR